MFDIGLQELVLIFVIALLVFGPKNLPQLGRSLGRAMREFKRASDEFRTTIETNLEMNAPDPIPHSATSSPPAETATVAAADATGRRTSVGQRHESRVYREMALVGDNGIIVRTHVENGIKGSTPTM